jgi:SPP1 gp7 family putative phage head morphogenesis protein
VRALQDYTRLIAPWANSQARQMVGTVVQRDATAWREHSEAIGTQLRSDVYGGSATGARVQELVAEGADLITSLPWQAAERVTKLSLEAAVGGKRLDEVQAEIMRTGEVTESRARLIARTEVGRAASAITQARAERIGSKGYIWRTSRDADVRPSHRRMEGQFVAWDDPPTLDGMTGHAGALPNCRCYAEPVIPDLE